jgi:hypothetical protein
MISLTCGTNSPNCVISDSDDRALEILSQSHTLGELSSTMNAITNLTPRQLRQAADIQERILTLQDELTQLLGSSAQPSLETTGRKRKLSAQGLANIRAGARKRWAKSKGDNGTNQVSSAPRRKMSAAGRARIAAQLRARWAAAKRAGRNAL